MSIVVVVGLAVALFVLAFVTKRRFGVLGLALCAGVVLSKSLSSDVAPILTQNGIELVAVSSNALAACLLILMPSLLLLFRGPKYSKRFPAIVGALAYGVLAALLVLAPLSGSLVTDASSREILLQISKFESMLIAILVGFALLDALFLPAPKVEKKKDEH